jgi:hypothetical protein
MGLPTRHIRWTQTRLAALGKGGLFTLWTFGPNRGRLRAQPLAQPLLQFFTLFLKGYPFKPVRKPP